MSKARDISNIGTTLSTVSTTELGYVDGVTSAIQTQINTKLATATAATTYVANTGYFVGGKNKIINGDFGIWQRGATFNSITSSVYHADRFTCYVGGGTHNITRQTFTPGAAPVSGYESQYYLRWSATSAGPVALTQRMEDVRLFAGQTLTFSFWAKADSAITINTGMYQYFGSGGSGTITQTSGNQAITTSWARYSFTFNVASISGKTIGAGNYLQLDINPPNSTFVFDTWGWQVEAGSTATAFQTATGTVQGELAACQRYYLRVAGGSAYYPLTSSGFSVSTTQFYGIVSFPVQMRIAPSALEQTGTAANYGVNEAGSGFTCNAVPTFSNATVNMATTAFPFASGLTTGRGGFGRNDNNTAAYLGWSAEL
jgi:hypothetical protein